MYIDKKLAPWLNAVSDTVFRKHEQYKLQYAPRMLALADEALRSTSSVGLSKYDICTRHTLRNIINSGVSEEMDASEVEFMRLWTNYWQRTKVNSLERISLRSAGITNIMHDFFSSGVHDAKYDDIEAFERDGRFFIRLTVKIQRMDLICSVWGNLVCNSLVAPSLTLSSSGRELADISLLGVSAIPYFQLRCADGLIDRASMFDFSVETSNLIRIASDQIVLHVG